MVHFTFLFDLPSVFTILCLFSGHSCGFLSSPHSYPTIFTPHYVVLALISLLAVLYLPTTITTTLVSFLNAILAFFLLSLVFVSCLLRMRTCAFDTLRFSAIHSIYQSCFLFPSTTRVEEMCFQDTNFILFLFLFSALLTRIVPNRTHAVIATNCISTATVGCWLASFFCQKDVNIGWGRSPLYI